MKKNIYKLEYNKYSFLIIFIIFGLSLNLIFEIKKFPTKIKSLRNLSINKNFLENVYGDSSNLNYYYTTLYLGSKKMPQTYIVDTGSEITTSTCSLCKECGKHFNKHYEIKDKSQIISCKAERCKLIRSSGCNINKQCSFSISYLEGSSISGIYLNEDVYFEKINQKENITSNSYNIPIGCTTRETHLFLTQLADGIMGLNHSGKSFVDLLFNKKIISKNLFSLCFGQIGGYFSLGEIDSTYHNNTEINYAPFSYERNNYFVKIDKLEIGSKIINLKKLAMIDSGTTISYFPNEIFNEIIKGFNSFCEIKGNSCGEEFYFDKEMGYCSKFLDKVTMSSSITEKWPNITIFLNGNKYIWTPENYFFNYSSKNELIGCLGFDSDYSSKITLGTTFMHGHDIIFDREQNRLGFIEADCNRGKILTERDKINREKNEKANNQNILYFIRNSKAIYLLILSSIIIIILVFIILLLLFKIKICKKRKLSKNKYYPQVDIENNKKGKANIIEVNSSK